MRRSRSVVLGVLSALGLFLVATNALVLLHRTEATPTGTAAGSAPTPALDCALVLGAGVGPDGTPSPVLEDRLVRALDLYRAGAVKRLLVSGDHRTHAYDEPNAMRAWLEERGVPPEVIFMDHAGIDTYSSVWRAKHVFGAERIVVVTQRFHLPRALWLASVLGMRAEGAVADRRLYRGAAWFELREIVSRSKAVVDARRERRPRHGGPSIPLAGDGRVTAG